MKKGFIIFLTSLILISGFFVAPKKTGAQTPPLCNQVPGYIYDASAGKCIPQAQAGQQQNDAAAKTPGCGWTDIVCDATKTIAWILLKLSSLILIIVGGLFNWVLDFTIVQMADKLNDTNGIGGSINNAWATLRDLANIVFIFVLLWAALQTILELNTSKFGTTIKNIIIVALLINFSMFFTKVVIDASNIATIGFYKSILASAGSKTYTVSIGENETAEMGNLSGVFMQALKVQSFWGSTGLEDASATNFLVLGVMGAATILILCVVLTVALVMFVTRFILLIFIIILSAPACVGFVLPGMRGQFDKWKDALISQAFFAPYFMLMMWVAIKLINSPGFITFTGGGGAEFAQVVTKPQSSIGLFLNFVLVIGFIIGALILSKEMAAKTPYFSKVNGAGSAALGAVTVGAAGTVGRQTVGRIASRLEKDTGLQQALARTRLGTAVYSGIQKTARSSFDARAVANTSLGKKTGLGNLIQDLGPVKGDGGFEKYKENKTTAVTNRGKIFTDKSARANYAKRKANEWFTKGGSNSSINSLLGAVGSSNRIAAVTLIDERMTEIKSDINAGRSEINTYNRTMGVTAASPATSAMVAASSLSTYEKQRYFILSGMTPPGGFTVPPGKSISDMSADLAALQTDKTSAGLDNTKKQQF